MLKKVEKINNLLACPNCYSDDLRFEEQKIKCNSCKTQYSILKGVPELITPNDKKELNREIEFTRRYFRMERVPKTTYKLLKILDRIYVPNLLYHLGPVDIKKYTNRKSLVLKIGGKDKGGNNFINLDIIYHPYTNILGNVERIPLKDNSVDFVHAVAVFHHLKNPEKSVKEIYRVLKKGGHIYAEDHFYYPYHADPRDCYRWTKEGYKLLFQNFKEIELKLIHGPTTSLLKLLQIYLPSLFSFNSVYLYELEYIFFSYLLYPFKFLDILLKKSWKADFISGGYAFLGKK